jgi:CRISPR-associated protein Csx17
MNELVLDGCRPIPLAGYLKALAVLRLVAEQADAEARGWWEGDRFRLRTALDRDGLAHFFLQDYRPTPIIAPWNGGSGFYPKDAKDGISALQTSNLARFAAYREAIDLGARLIRERKLTERPADEAKGELIAALRAEAGAELIGWMDAAIALTLDRMAFPPLLGTGGNDGRLDFTNNIMQRLTEIIPPNGDEPTADVVAALGDALFATPVAGLSSAPIGQFAPGAAGGPNSAAGFQGDPLVNRWDFVLMLEGALVFGGGVSRRLEGADAGYLSYPFTVRPAAAGYGSASLGEQTDTRGELWAPLWERPARYAEVRALFREGRLSLGARPARDGLDAARAVGSLGVNRGVTSFERYGFVKRQGLAYLAAPLGRWRVEPNPRGDLLNDLDRNRWLENLRNKATSDDASAELRATVRSIEDCIFEVLEQPSRASIQDVLIAFGAAVRAVAVRPKLQEALRPPRQLSSLWVIAADDRSPEFRLAVALAGLSARLKASEDSRAVASDGAQNPTHLRPRLPMRAHLGPLDLDSRAPQWSAEKGGALVVWGAGRLVDNLCAVAQRRLLEQTRGGLEAPFDSGFDRDGEQDVAVAVDSGEIVSFLDGEVQDERIAELLLGLAWVQPGDWTGERRAAPLPFAYAALKPLFTPHSVFDWLRKNDRLNGDLRDLPMPPALPLLLIAGRVQEAVLLAQERARASGLPTPFLRRTPPAQGRTPDPDFGRRLLAALIIPVRVSVVGACLSRAYSRSNEESQHVA